MVESIDVYHEMKASIDQQYRLNPELFPKPSTISPESVNVVFGVLLSGKGVIEFSDLMVSGAEVEADGSVLASAAGEQNCRSLCRSLLRSMETMLEFYLLKFYTPPRLCCAIARLRLSGFIGRITGKTTR